MRELWRTLVGRRRRFVLILLGESVLSGIEALVHPLLLKAVFDQAILRRDFGSFIALGGAYLLLGLTINAAVYAIAASRKRYENALVLALELELLDQALDADGRRVAQEGSASFVSRVHNDVHEGVLPAIDTSIDIAKQALASVAFVGVLIYLSWQASLVLLVIVPPLVYVSNRIAKRIEDVTEPERQAEAHYVEKLTRTLEAFHALRGLPSLRAGTRTVNRVALEGFLGITFVTFRLNLRQRTLSDLVMNVSDTASMIVGAYFVFAGRLSFGGFLAFVNSLWRAVTGIFGLINLIPQLRRCGAILRRINGLADVRTREYYAHGPRLLVRGTRVDYGDGTVVELEEFEVGPGEHVLVRGPNGSGKTTLLHVIAGTLEPDAGAVTLPARVASLTAPVHLPPVPVADLVGDLALRTALDLHGVLDQLPTELSSGQRQRVGVAALLCEDADVYVVDEPFANLDQRGRDAVLTALEDRARGRGLIVVHHGDDHLDDRFDRVIALPGTRVPAQAVPSA